MVVRGLSYLTDTINEGKAFREVLELKAPEKSVAFEPPPVRSLDTLFDLGTCHFFPFHSFLVLLIIRIYFLF